MIELAAIGKDASGHSVVAEPFLFSFPKAIVFGISVSLFLLCATMVGFDSLFPEREAETQRS